MYPQRELTRLAAHKAVLGRRIVRRRAECASLAAPVMRPIELLDRVLGLWRQLAPLAAIPLGLVAARLFSRRMPRLRALVQWSPVVLAIARRFRAPVHRAR